MPSRDALAIEREWGSNEQLQAFLHKKMKIVCKSNPFNGLKFSEGTEFAATSPSQRRSPAKG